ncbi:MAG: trigger factor [Planctomycetes bacterium]|nr:trigger factor [Planctomycetota bacterium]
MDVKVEDVAACKKKLSITIPREEIEQKFNERYTELEREAQVPGFRPGRAPRRLVEKRFRDAVAEEVRAKLVSEGFEKAVKDQDLDVIGEPEIDPEKIELPDEGPMTFSIELEVRPKFELPADYTGIPLEGVKQPEVTEAAVAQALEHLREQQGRLEPLAADAEIQANDLVTCDLTIQAGDVMVVDHQNVRLPVAAIAIEGIRLDNLPDLLKGAKVGDVREAKITIGGDAEREDVRGKEADLRLKIDSAARVILPDDAALLKAADYEDMDSLKTALHRQQENQSEAAFRRAQEEAVQNWLLEKVPFDLPEELAKRHANRLLQRQLVNLQYRGIPAQEIEKRIDDIRGASTEQAARDLKLHFVLDAIAEKEKIEATDAEVDARVRFIAAQYGRREDRVREEMASEGTLESLRGQILEDKVLRMLLDKAARKAEPAADAPAPESDADAPAPESDAGPAEST